MQVSGRFGTSTKKANGSKRKSVTDGVIVKNLSEVILNTNFDQEISFGQEFTQSLIDIAADCMISNAHYQLAKKHQDIWKKNRDFFRYTWNRANAYERKNFLYGRRPEIISISKARIIYEKKQEFFFSSEARDPAIGLIRAKINPRSDLAPEIIDDFIYLIRKILAGAEGIQDTESTNFLVDFNLVSESPKSHLNEYLRLKEIRHDLANIWGNDGLKGSEDPDFYETLWLETKRETGYVERQKEIIASCSVNAGRIPSAITNLVLKSTRATTKAELVVALCSCISYLSKMILEPEFTRYAEKTSILQRIRDGQVKQLVSLMLTVEERANISPINVIDALQPHELIWMAQNLKRICSPRELQELEKKLSS